MIDFDASTATDQSHLDVARVLLLLQGAIGLLSGAAMLIFMGGNPLAWPVTLGLPLMLLVLAGRVTRRRNWARKMVLGVQWLVLLGFVVSMLLGLLAQIDFSLNLMTLITNVLLPVSVIRLLRKPVAAVEPAAVGFAVLGHRSAA